MIITFVASKEGKLRHVDVPPAKATWIDIFKPTWEERNLIEKEINIALPMHHEMHQLEYSNRFYEEDKVIFLSLNMVTKAHPLPESHAITFIITKNQLISLRYSSPDPIETFIENLGTKSYPLAKPLDILYLLLEKIVGVAADMFELVEEKTDDISHSLASTMGAKNKQLMLQRVLHEVNRLDNLLSKVYQSLVSLRLFSPYLRAKHHLFPEGALEPLAGIDQDVSGLSAHGDYLAQKISFQLQTTFGLINIEQTNIIKTFTVLAMIFMPPTLIASVYGMNFHFMPELNLIFGYPLAIVLMIISAFVPYLLFKRKGWI